MYHIFSLNLGTLSVTQFFCCNSIFFIMSNEYDYHIDSDSTSVYKWTCSPYDSANDKYYLPYFGETAFQFIWQSSTPGTTFIYPINGNDLNCAGLVTALEFCYTTTLPSNNPVGIDIFIFFLLDRLIATAFDITKTILVRATPFTAHCMNSNPRRCCEIMQFNNQDQFNITSSNLTVAIGPQLYNGSSYQGFFPGLHQMYDAITHLTSVPLTTGSMRFFNIPVQHPHRLAWLHIGEYDYISLH